MDLDAVIFNLISSATLKSLRFKVVNWMHDFQPWTAMIWDCLHVGLQWLHHIQSLAIVTMATTAIVKVGRKSSQDFLFSLSLKNLEEVASFYNSYYALIEYMKK
jgi:hypothetical protein